MPLNTQDILIRMHCNEVKKAHHGETTHLSGEFSVAQRNSETEMSLFSLFKENVIGSREVREEKEEEKRNGERHRKRNHLFQLHKLNCLKFKVLEHLIPTPNLKHSHRPRKSLLI